jgi:hypothetical protein
MAVIGRVADAEAMKWTGDPVVDPGAGELIVTPANDAPARLRVILRNRIAFFTALYSFRGRFLISRSEGYELIYSGCIGIGLS